MLIGITGKKYHGKDTAATPLVQLGFKPYFFASSFKSWCLDIVMAKAGMKGEEAALYIYGSKKQDVIPGLGISGRELMQKVGAWGREINEDLWADMLFFQALSGVEKPKVVITDVRHFNECLGIQKRGGKVIRIVNPRVEDDEFSNHESERHIMNLPVDAQLINGGTIEELHCKVVSTLVKLNEGFAI